MRSPLAPSLTDILAAQNADGGWGYYGEPSWTEPTVYASLALAAGGQGPENGDRAVRWLLHCQQPDGGWPPQPSVAQSTWVTALVVLLLAGRDESPALDNAVGWLLRQSGKESSFLHRLRLKLQGLESGKGDAEGWPWFPNTAAWVSPTALTIVALRKVNARRRSVDLERRIERGRRFLLSRMCSDGGWNHGSSRALGYDASSYPETTGQALVALHGTASPQLKQGIAAAERHLQTCRSAEGLSWLRLGLLAHSRIPDIPAGVKPLCRSVPDASLSLLAQAAEEGRNLFL